LAPYSLVDIFRRCGGLSVNVCRARWRHSAQTVTSSHHHGKCKSCMHCPSFRNLFHVHLLRLLCSTVTAHFTRIARIRRDASQRTARAPSLSSDPETVLTVETASHLATFEPQILVPSPSETDLPGITHPLLHDSIVPLSVFGVTHKIVLP
jgi:hypothetical protein